MSLRSFLLVASLLSLSFAPLHAQKTTWMLQSGDSVDGEIIGLYRGIVYVDVGNGRTFYVPFNSLTEESQQPAKQWMIDFIQRRQQGPSKVSDSDSPLTQFLANNLYKREGEELVPYDFRSKNEPEFYAFYYSAHWCGPCRRFTPKLRAFYNGLKSLGYDDFEIIFVSSDTSPKKMRAYMEEDEMPWPAIRYNKTNHRMVSKYKGNGIPCLVVTDKRGRLLFHSYRGDEYLGPDNPKEKLNDLLQFLKTLDDKLANL